eukprot:TRINITY_DN18158_c0_g1_i1.p1 TRINITY_DN18158_c0_g1~~TRINITY_DN18158_c0_g1_i1.p1  ORF type:complete len:232 (+),score=19.98 TRINITY_DN18158_c0_g1_i1:64-759(+)
MMRRNVLRVVLGRSGLGMRFLGKRRYSKRNLGSSILDPQKSILFVCDLQERFVDKMVNMDPVIHNSQALIKAAHIFQIPIVCSEQYPKGLGHTVPQIHAELRTPHEASGNLSDVHQYSKTSFSMLTPEIEAHISQYKERNQIILCGIETHICVFQTALDLLNDSGYQVHLIDDATTSSALNHRAVACSTLQSRGAILSTMQSAIFQLVGDKDHPHFKDLSKISLPPPSVLN